LVLLQNSYRTIPVPVPWKITVFFVVPKRFVLDRLATSKVLYSNPVFQ
jgi:hypothetical protein